MNEKEDLIYKNDESNEKDLKLMWIVQTQFYLSTANQKVFRYINTNECKHKFVVCSMDECVYYQCKHCLEIK